MAKLKTLKKAALVTGGSKRIGKAIALKLASVGYDVALHYNRSSLEAKKTALQIEKNDGRCVLFRCELGNERDASALIKRVKQKLPQLNVLVNNASIFEKSKLQNASLDSFNRHFSVNFKAPFILTRDFSKICKRGHVINILDTHITSNHTNYLTYLLSKKALWELTKLSAVELAPHIRVNGIAPGLILPPANAKKGYLNRLAKNIPLKNKGEASQIAACLEFLINNPYITGQILFNDGGEHLI